MESKEELSSASYEERGSKVDGSVNKWKSNERKHWKETNKQMMKRRKQIKVGIYLRQRESIINKISKGMTSLARNWKIKDENESETK